MGEHKFNPVARAAQHGTPARVLLLGEGYGLVGLGLEPIIKVEDDGSQYLVVAVMAIGGKPSDLAPMEPVKFMLGEVGKIPLADVRATIEEGLSRPREASGQ